MIIVYRPVFRRSIFNLSKISKQLSKETDEYPNAQRYTIVKKFQYPKSLIYQLISRVDLYNEFIPYCTSSFINERDSITNEPSIAGLRVGFQSFNEEFTCELQCLKDNKVIAKSITHSLFKILETEWNVKDEGDYCIAKLELKYEFKSSLYNQVSSIFAKNVSNLMINAFNKRALEVSKNNKLLQKYI